MTKKEAQQERNALEAKYTRIAIDAGLVLEKGDDGRFFSVSPGKIKYLSNGAIDAPNYDKARYSELSNILHAHSGERSVVENKIQKYFITENSKKTTTLVFLLKNNFFGLNFEEFNQEIKYFGYKSCNKRQYLEVQNFFKKFSALSKEEHYNVTKEEKKQIRYNMKNA